jgi:hypothetical protein
MGRQQYWAVRPRTMPEAVRIEKAATPEGALRLAFGTVSPQGGYEAKTLGTTLAVVRSDRRRMEALTSVEGWIILGKPIPSKRGSSQATGG